jgi:hypothetical protein
MIVTLAISAAALVGLTIAALILAACIAGARSHDQRHADRAEREDFRRITFHEDDL